MANHPEPMAAEAFRHSTPCQLRFNDIDALGHVNNNVYLQFFDLGKYMYFTEVMGDSFDMEHLAVVVVNINCDFFQPAVMGEALCVRTAVSAVGDKSLTLIQQVYDRNSAAVKCQCATIMATFDRETHRSTPVDSGARAAISRYENRSF